MELVIPAGEKRELFFVYDKPETIERVVRLAGEGAEVRISEIFLSDNVSSNVKVIHDARCTVSRISVRGVVNSKVSSHAKVIMLKHAQLSDSFVGQHFLVLDSSAEVDALPSLEIEADEVKAAHAATVRQLDDSELFYLRSRGLSESETKRLFIEGFLKLPEKYDGVIEKWIK